MEKITLVELPPTVDELEIIGDGECLCGVPGCAGHPVIASGPRETIEFTNEQYQFLLGDLQRRMTA